MHLRISSSDLQSRCRRRSGHQVETTEIHFWRSALQDQLQKQYESIGFLTMHVSQEALAFLTHWERWSILILMKQKKTCHHLQRVKRSPLLRRGRNNLWLNCRGLSAVGQKEYPQEKPARNTQWHDAYKLILQQDATESPLVPTLQVERNTGVRLKTRTR